MEYIKASKAAEKWGISPRRVRVLCAEGKIEGVIRKGKLYMIPENAEKPVDGRKGKTNFLLEIEKKRALLSTMRPLTAGEVARLAEEFMIEFTYNSNAIEGNTLTLKETAMVLEGMTIDQKPLKDHLEAVGHRDAFVYVEGIAKNTIISEAVIKNIHSLVLMNRPEDKVHGSIIEGSGAFGFRPGNDAAGAFHICTQEHFHTRISPFVKMDPTWVIFLCRSSR